MGESLILDQEQGTELARRAAEDHGQEIAKAAALEAPDRALRPSPRGAPRPRTARRARSVADI